MNMSREQWEYQSCAIAQLARLLPIHLFLHPTPHTTLEVAHVLVEGVEGGVGVAEILPRHGNCLPVWQRHVCQLFLKLPKNEPLLVSRHGC